MDELSTGKSRRLTVILIAIGLLIVAGLVVWNAQEKIPAGPAEGSSLQGPPAATQPNVATLRVATFNIDGGAEGLDRVAHVLGGFDLAGLQEVHGLGQTNTLAQSLHLPFVYAPVESQWWIKSFGNAAFTDLPVTHWQRIPISSNDSDSNRNVILLIASFSGRPLNVLVTHIDRKQDHATEIREVGHLFLSLAEPAILMGDFNLTQDSSGQDNDRDVDELRGAAGVIDPIGKGYDRIFARGFVAVNSGAIEEHASDHPLAWAELRVAQP
jgi:endonuclease/exonuclease/phosphatase family metal-dependent hydrolase